MRYGQILAARSVRMLAYGAISVIFAIYLAKAGLRGATIGAVISVALLSGATFSITAGWLGATIGTRALMVGGAILMACAGALLAWQPPLGGAVTPASLAVIFVAAALGTISPGGQEVGPFTAIEQAAIAEIGERYSARRYAVYGVLGSLGLAIGALATSVLSTRSIMWAFAITGLVLALIYLFIEDGSTGEVYPPQRASRARHIQKKWGPAESLAALFGIDALAGGFVVQSIIAYWLYVKFGASPQVLGVVFFAANVLSALSLFAAARLSERIGLLNTMVFTHLPSNVLLILIPIMPTFPLAVALLLARFAISQMDVPTRQAFTMAAVPADDRARAAGLTNAVRPVAAAIAPALSGIALQSVASGFPFYAAGALKIAYDLTLYALFKRREKRV